MDKVLQFIRANLLLLPVVLLTITVTWYITSMFKQDEMDVYINQYNDYRERVEETQHFADSLQSIVDEYGVQIEQLNDSVDAKTSELTRVNRRVIELSRQTAILRSRLTDSLMAQIPPEVANYITALEAENTELKNNVSAAEALIATTIQRNQLLVSSLQLETTRADSLASVIADLPPPPSNPNKILGFIPKPSRTQTFIIGVVVGGVATWKLIG